MGLVCVMWWVLGECGAGMCDVVGVGECGAGMCDLMGVWGMWGWYV